MPSTKPRRYCKKWGSTILIVCSVLIMSPHVMAHSVVAPMALHGGKALAAGSYHLELVVTDGHVQLYLYDRDNHFASVDGITAKALIWTQANTLDVVLTPDKRNMMSGAGAFSVSDVRRVIVTLVDDTGVATRAWFPFSQLEDADAVGGN